MERNDEDFLFELETGPAARRLRMLPTVVDGDCGTPARRAGRPSTARRAGLRLTSMLVRDLAHPNVLAAQSSDRLTDAAKVMLREGVGSLVVFNDGDAVGILTERDLVRAVAEGGPRVAEVGDYMSQDTEFALAEEDCLLAAERMLTMGVRHLPVLEGGKVVGMVSARDLLALVAWPPLRKRPTASKRSLVKG